jgi:CheY-like chemotaxis protein
VTEGEHRRLRKAEDEVRAILDRLDRDRPPDEVVHLRTSTRYSYRVSALVVEFPSQRPTTSHAVPSRNISREGVAFLLGNFVYPRTRCRIQLVNQHGRAQIVDGVVVRCRYVEGSASVYEVGVKLDHPIDVTMFQQMESRVRVLLADDDPFHGRLVERLLRPLGAELTFVQSGRQAIEAALSGDFDLILMGLDIPEIDGLTATKELRSRGYAVPIVAVAADADQEVAAKCLRAGFSDWIGKPLTRKMLVNAVQAARSQALVSSFVEDADMAELIDQFVAQLSESTGQLELAFQQQDYQALQRLARLIKGQAGACGFEVISEAAVALEQALTADADAAPSAIRAQLNALIRYCAAARPASYT